MWIEKEVKTALILVCEVVLPRVEKDYGLGKIRGVNLASLILERSIGEGWNCSVFNVLANVTEDDKYNEIGREFVDYVTRVATDGDPKNREYATIDVAIGYVLALLPEKYRFWD